MKVFQLSNILHFQNFKTYIHIQTPSTISFHNFISPSLVPNLSYSVKLIRESLSGNSPTVNKMTYQDQIKKSLTFLTKASD